jgi:peptidoglycan/LPS O-acetylase OafA/YrhL
LLAVLFCLASLLYLNPLAMLGRDFLGDAAAAWLGHSGSVLAFGALIFVFAKGRRRSRLMTLPVLVLLGEISYSCYLIHHILLYTYHANAAKFAHVPDAAAFSIFLVVLFLVLVPPVGARGNARSPAPRGRRMIHGTPAMRRSWRVFLRPSRPLFAGISACPRAVHGPQTWPPRTDEVAARRLSAPRPRFLPIADVHHERYRQR